MKVGDTIRIEYMKGEDNYSGKVGVIERIDDAGHLHGTWGSLAILPNEDSITVLKCVKAD